MTHFRAQTLVTPDKRQLRVAVWDLPEGQMPRAVCVLLNGHTEFIEKYSEVADELRARGFVVASLDWRGQGASDRRAYGNRAGHVGSFEEYDFDLAAFMLQVAEPLKKAAGLPIFALANSMGAHILLRFLSEHPRRFAWAVLTAPMLEIETGKYSPTMTQAVTAFFNLRKPSTRFVFGVENRDPLELKFEENLATSDRARFERNQALLKAQPYLRIFGPTFGWLGAALSSMARVRRKSFAESIATPLLVFGAGHDRIVRTSAVRDFTKMLPDARYVEIENAEHEILMENDAVRARFWAEFDTFIDAQLATKPESTGMRRASPWT